MKNTFMILAFLLLLLGALAAGFARVHPWGLEMAVALVAAGLAFWALTGTSLVS